jgi:hypothetical protein
MTSGEWRRFARPVADWDKLAEAGLAFLVERARMGRLTSYTELNTILERRTGLPKFDFEQEVGRAAMGSLLGEIVDLSYLSAWRVPADLMISALVTYLNENDAGPGFYAFAKAKHLLQRGADSSERFEFWVTQVQRLHEYFATSRSAAEHRGGSAAD